MRGRIRANWSDREWELFRLLDERGLVVDAWPNGRLLRDCRVCGNGFLPVRSSNRGPFPIECSSSCRRVYAAWNVEQWREGLKELPSECAWCFGEFKQDRNGSGNRSRFCSNECQLLAAAHRSCNASMDRCEVPRCPQCGAITRKTRRKKNKKTAVVKRARGVCDDCRRERNRKQSLKQHLRPSRGVRARAYREGERPTPAGVLERCGCVCYLCGEEIDLTITNRHDPGYLNIDHLIPLVLGGRDTYENVAPTHRRCNNKKGVKLVGYIRWAEGPVKLL
jgi:5-methylcytosine-specific restriction endonuclease McrA